MPRKVNRLVSLLLCFFLIFEQSGFAQTASLLDLSLSFASLKSNFTPDKFRPLHLRYLEYDASQNNFQILLDKGDINNPQAQELESSTGDLLRYFLVGVTLPNDAFWVNLRPDAEDQTIDPALGQTDVGRILLEADLQLKKDTALATSPQTPEGKKYWEKLYAKAEELFGYDSVTIPTLTRPWIVPDEIIIRETEGSAYIYKATLKVMLEEDYLQSARSQGRKAASEIYRFDDPRLKALNEYASELMRQLIIPKLTKEVNIAKRYAPLRQVYYSLTLAQWFKSRFYGQSGAYSRLIDKQNLDGLTSKEPWSKSDYFKAYQKSFKDGEYNIKTPVHTPFGQSIRNYFSGGIVFPQLPPVPTISSPVARKDGTTRIFSGRGNKPRGNGKHLLGAQVNSPDGALPSWERLTNLIALFNPAMRDNDDDRTLLQQQPVAQAQRPDEEIQPEQKASSPIRGRKISVTNNPEAAAVERYETELDLLRKKKADISWFNIPAVISLSREIRDFMNNRDRFLENEWVSQGQKNIGPVKGLYDAAFQRLPSTAQGFAQLMDEWCREVLNAFGLSRRVALIAAGSFGRRTAPFGTDFDLFFIAGESEKIPVGVRRAVVGALAERLPVDAKSSPTQLQDPTVWVTPAYVAQTYGKLSDAQKTALLDARLVNSNIDTERIFKFLTEQVLEAKVLAPDIGLLSRFLRDFKRMHATKDMHKDTPFEISRGGDFNVKFDRGGTREIDYILWAGRLLYRIARHEDALPRLVTEGVISEEERRTIEEALGFFISLRSQINFYLFEEHGKKADSLSEHKDHFYSDQVRDVSAQRLGYTTAQLENKILGYRQAISRIGARMGQRLQDELVASANPSTGTSSSPLKNAGSLARDTLAAGNRIVFDGGWKGIIHDSMVTAIFLQAKLLLMARLLSARQAASLFLRLSRHISSLFWDEVLEETMGNGSVVFERLPPGGYFEDNELEIHLMPIGNRSDQSQLLKEWKAGKVFRRLRGLGYRYIFAQVHTRDIESICQRMGLRPVPDDYYDMPGVRESLSSSREIYNRRAKSFPGAFPDTILPQPAVYYFDLNEFLGIEDLYAPGVQAEPGEGASSGGASSPLKANEEIVSHDLRVFASRKFTDLALSESVGGNAGRNRAGANVALDSDGRIIDVGNPQNWRPKLRAEWEIGRRASTCFSLLATATPFPGSIELYATLGLDHLSQQAFSNIRETVLRHNAEAVARKGSAVEIEKGDRIISTLSGTKRDVLQINGDMARVKRIELNGQTSEIDVPVQELVYNVRVGMALLERESEGLAQRLEEESSFAEQVMSQARSGAEIVFPKQNISRRVHFSRLEGGNFVGRLKAGDSVILGGENGTRLTLSRSRGSFVLKNDKELFVLSKGLNVVSRGASSRKQGVVRMQKDTVSRIQAVLDVVSDNEVRVYDAGSTNGTAAELQDGTRKIVRFPSSGNGNFVGEAHNGDIIILGGEKGALVEVQKKGDRFYLVDIKTKENYAPDGLIEGENVIGRGANAGRDGEIRVNNEQVSRIQAVISVSGAALRVYDAGSTNGTAIVSPQKDRAGIEKIEESIRPIVSSLLTFLRARETPPSDIDMATLQDVARCIYNKQQSLSGPDQVAQVTLEDLRNAGIRGDVPGIIQNNKLLIDPVPLGLMGVASSPGVEQGNASSPLAIGRSGTAAGLFKLRQTIFLRVEASKLLGPLSGRGKIDLRHLDEVLNRIEGIEEGHRGIIAQIIGLFKKDAPAVYTFDSLVYGADGYVLPKDNAIVLYEGLLHADRIGPESYITGDEAVNLFRFLTEFLSEQKALQIELRENRLIIRSAPSVLARLFGVYAPLGEVELAQEILTEVREQIQMSGQDRTAVLLAALRRQIFKAQDEQLGRTLSYVQGAGTLERRIEGARSVEALEAIISGIYTSEGVDRGLPHLIKICQILESSRWGGEEGSRAKRVLSELRERLQPKIERSRFRRVLFVKGRQDSQDTIESRLSGLFAWAALADMHRPVVSISQQELERQIARLKAKSGLSLPRLAQGELSLLRRFVHRELENLRQERSPRAGVIDAEAFDQLPEFYRDIQEVARRIMSACGLPENAVNVFLLDNSGPEAAVIQGVFDRIFLQPAFLHKVLGSAITKDAVAAVIAHEMAHLIYHIRQVMATGKMPAPTPGVSQAEEEYADTLALKIMDAAGYNPLALPEFFRTLLKTEQFNIPLSHPTSDQRYRELQRHVLSFAYRNKEKPFQSFSAESANSLAQFAGTYARLVPLASTEQDQLRDLERSAKETESRWQNRTIATPQELVSAYEQLQGLLRQLQGWLSNDISFSSWRGARGLIDSLAYEASRLMDITPAADNGFVQQIANLRREVLDNFSEIEKVMRRKAAVFNAAALWEKDYYYSVVSRLGIEEAWSNQYKERLRQQLRQGQDVLRRTVEGEIIPELLTDLLLAEKESIITTLGRVDGRVEAMVGTGRYVELLKACALRLRFEPARYRKTLDLLLVLAETGLVPEAWKSIFDVMTIFFKVDPHGHSPYKAAFTDSQNMQLLHEQEAGDFLVRLCAKGLGQAATRRLTRDWLAKGYFVQRWFADGAIFRIVDLLEPAERKVLLLGILRNNKAQEQLFSARQTGLGGQSRLVRDALLINIVDRAGLSRDRVFLRELLQAVNNAGPALEKTSLASSRPTHNTELSVLLELAESQDAQDRVSSPISGREIDAISDTARMKALGEFFAAGGWVEEEDFKQLIAHGNDPQALALLRQALNNDKVRNKGIASMMQAGFNLGQARAYWGRFLLYAGMRQAELATGTRINLRDALWLNLFTDDSYPTLQRTYYHRGDVLLERLQEHNRYQGPIALSEALRAHFPFVLGSEPYAQTYSMIKEYLPASIYRNYCLYIAFVHKRLGVPLEEVFSRQAVGEALVALGEQERIEAVQEVAQEMILDFQARWGAGLSVYSGFSYILGTDERAKYDETQGSFLDGTYYTNPANRPEFQLDLLLYSLIGDELYEYLSTSVIENNAKAFDERLSVLKDKFFKRASGMRDRCLERLAEFELAQATSPEEKLKRLGQIIPLFESENLQQQYKLRALDIEVSILTAQAPTSQQMGKIKDKIVEYFPQPSPLRDDLLDSLVERYCQTKEEYLKVAELYSSVHQSEGRNLEARREAGRADTIHNIVLSLIQNVNSQQQRVDFLLWLLGLKTEKPDFLKKIELTLQLNLDALRQGLTPLQLDNFENAGLSLRKEFLISFLWDKNTGIFAGSDRENWASEGLWQGFSDELFFGVFGRNEETQRFKPVWDILFEVAPKKSWPLTEKMLVDLLLNLSSMKQRGEQVQAYNALACLFSSLGVIGIKLAQNMHSFGYFSDELAQAMEKLKFATPNPFLKRDLFRMMEYLGINGIQVHERIGEASVKVAYRVSKEGRTYAMKVLKPRVRYEKEKGIEIIREVQGRLEQESSQGRISEEFIIPRWLINFIARNLDEELDFALEVEHAQQLREGLGQLGWRDKVRLFDIVRHYEGGVRKAQQRLSELGLGQASSPGRINIPHSELMPGVADIILDDFIDGELYSKRGPDAMRDRGIAAEFFSMLARGFYHSDLHIGNVMSDESQTTWFLDAGSVDKLTHRTAVNAASLLRALQQKDARLIKKYLLRFYKDGGSDNLDNVIQGSLDRAGPLDQLMFILRKAHGEPSDEFVRLIKALNAVSYALRSQGIIPEGAGSQPQFAVGQQRATAAAGPLAGMESLPTAELVRTIEFGTDTALRSQAIEVMLSRLENNKLSPEFWNQSFPDFADKLMDIVLAQGYSYALRGKAFRLLSSLEFRSHSPRLETLRNDFVQELIRDNWLSSTSSQDTDKIDYLDGLLWLAIGFRGREVFNEADIGSLRGIVLGSNWPYYLRRHALQLLCLRMSRGNHLGANDAIMAVLTQLDNSGSSLGLKAFILHEFNVSKDSGAREGMDSQGQLSAFAIDYIERIFTGEIEDAVLRGELFQAGAYLAQMHSTVMPYERKQEIFFGEGRLRYAERLARLFEFLQQDLLAARSSRYDRRGTLSADEVLARTAWFLNDFISALTHRVFWPEENRLPNLEEGMRRLMAHMATVGGQGVDVFSFLNNIVVGERSVDVEENILDSYVNLWQLVTQQRELALIQKAGDNFLGLAQRASATQRAVIMKSLRTSSKADLESILSRLLCEGQNHRTLRLAMLSIIQNGKIDERLAATEVYLNASLYDFDTQRESSYFENSEEGFAGEFEEVALRLQRDFLGEGLPYEMRSRALSLFLDMVDSALLGIPNTQAGGEISKFVDAYRLQRFYHTPLASQHPFLARNISGRPYLRHLFDQAATVDNVLPTVMPRDASSDFTLFYKLLVSFVVTDRQSPLRDDPRFITRLREFISTVRFNPNLEEDRGFIAFVEQFMAEQEGRVSSPAPGSEDRRSIVYATVRVGDTLRFGRSVGTLISDEQQGIDLMLIAPDRRTILKHMDEGQIYRLGRAADNDIIVPDPVVSKHHAKLFPQKDGRVWIYDFSSNGSFINGLQVMPNPPEQWDRGIAGTASSPLGQKLMPAQKVFGRSLTAGIAAQEYGQLAQVAGPAHGFRRIIADGALEDISGMLSRLNLGFLLQRNIAYTRTAVDALRNRQRVYLIRSIRLPVNIQGGRELLSEILIPDFRQEQVPVVLRESLVDMYPQEILNKIQQSSVEWEKYQRLPEYFRDLIDRRVAELAQKRLPQRNEATMQQVMKAAVLHEVGEAIWTVLEAKVQAEDNAAARSYYQWWQENAGIGGAGVILIKNLVKSVVNGQDKFETEMFADRFALFADQQSIFLDFGEALTSDEHLFFASVVDFIVKEHESGGIFGVKVTGSSGPRQAETGQVSSPAEEGEQTELDFGQGAEGPGQQGITAIRPWDFGEARLFRELRGKRIFVREEEFSFGTHIVRTENYTFPALTLQRASDGKIISLIPVGSVEIPMLRFGEKVEDYLFIGNPRVNVDDPVVLSGYNKTAYVQPLLQGLADALSENRKLIMSITSRSTREHAGRFEDTAQYKMAQASGFSLAKPGQFGYRQKDKRGSESFVLTWSEMFPKNIDFDNGERVYVRLERASSPAGGKRFTATTNDASILPLTSGVVREGFVKPGLLVIADDRIFNQYIDVRYAYMDSDIEAANVGGTLLVEDYYRDRSKVPRDIGGLYLRFFAALHSEFPEQGFNRVALVAGDASRDRICHEILHDIINNAAENDPVTFQRLAELMGGLAGADRSFYAAYSRLSFGKSEFSLSAGLNEFVARFFSGEGVAAGTEEYVKEDYEYMLRNIPEEAKGLFYQLGLIWPKTAVASSPASLELKELANKVVAKVIEEPGYSFGRCAIVFHPDPENFAKAIEGAVTDERLWEENADRLYTYGFKNPEQIKNMGSITLDAEEVQDFREFEQKHNSKLDIASTSERKILILPLVIKGSLKGFGYANTGFWLRSRYQQDGINWVVIFGDEEEARRFIDPKRAGENPGKSSYNTWFRQFVWELARGNVWGGTLAQFAEDSFASPASSPGGNKQAAVAELMGGWLGQSITISAFKDEGIHQRPTAAIVERALEFKGTETRIIARGKAVNLQSVLAMSMLWIQPGDEVRIETRGPREEEALQALVGVLAPELELATAPGRSELQRRIIPFPIVAEEIASSPAGTISPEPARGIVSSPVDIRSALASLEGKRIKYNGGRFVIAVEQRLGSRFPWDTRVVLKHLPGREEVAYWEIDSGKGELTLDSGWLNRTDDSFADMLISHILVREVMKILPEGARVISNIVNRKTMSLLRAGVPFPRTRMYEIFSRAGCHIEYYYTGSSGRQYAGKDILRGMRRDYNGDVLTLELSRKVSSPIAQDSLKLAPSASSPASKQVLAPEQGLGKLREQMQQFMNNPDFRFINIEVDSNAFGAGKSMLVKSIADALQEMGWEPERPANPDVYSFVRGEKHISVKQAHGYLGVSELYRELTTRATIWVYLFTPFQPYSTALGQSIEAEPLIQLADITIDARQESRVAPEEMVKLLTLASSPAGETRNKKGGIDFRALPVAAGGGTPALPIGLGATQPLIGPQPIVHSPQIGTVILSLDKEWQEIQNMVNSGIIPSNDRIKEYLQGCCGNKNFENQIDKVLSCIADILRIEEERVEATEPCLQEFLVLLESDKGADEFRAALSKIEVSAKEPMRIEE